MTRSYVEREELGEYVVLLREAVEDYLGVNLSDISYVVATLQ